MVSSLEKNFRTPILFLIFNRPDTTIAVFNEIKKIKPTKLYIAADGPRQDNANDKINCLEARNIIENQIDWDCQVKKLFRNENLGCKIAVSSAVNWFFENEEEGIIIEDDCLPGVSFFEFCRELLEYYRNDNRIMMISGDNFQSNNKLDKNSYSFVRYSYIWGWATWRRAWKYYDVNISKFPAFKDNTERKNVFQTRDEKEYWLSIFQNVYEGKIDTWDYQWSYALFWQNGISIIPNVNLVSNIGFGQSGTHTSLTNNPLANLKTFEIGKIVHPRLLIVNYDSDEFTFNQILKSKNKKTFVAKIFNKIKSFKKKLLDKYKSKSIQGIIKNRNNITSREHFNRIKKKGINIFFENGFSVYNGHQNVYLGSNIYLIDTLINAGNKEGSITIDDYVFFGHGVKLLARGHDYNLFMAERQGNIIEKPIHIKEGAWIGSGSIILGGVVVGKNSVVGAGSIVVRDVPDYAIVAGNPARVIKEIKKDIENI